MKIQYLTFFLMFLGVLTPLQANKKDPSDLTRELYWAVRENNFDKVQKLVEVDHADVNEIYILEGKCRTLLHFAVENRSLKILKYLISKNAHVNAQDYLYRTPLHTSSLMQNKYENETVAIVECLLSNGALVDARDLDNATPLHYSAEKGTLKICKILVKRDAQIDALKKDESTPLHHAAQEGHTNVVRYLVKKKANINALSLDYKATPLHYAAFNDRSETVRCLVELGARTDIKNNEDKTPREVASINTISYDYLKNVEQYYQTRSTVITNTLNELTIPNYPLLAAVKGNLCDVHYLCEDSQIGFFTNHVKDIQLTQPLKQSGILYYFKCLLGLKTETQEECISEGGLRELIWIYLNYNPDTLKTPLLPWARKNKIIAQVLMHRNLYHKKNINSDMSFIFN